MYKPFIRYSFCEVTDSEGRTHHFMSDQFGEAGWAQGVKSTQMQASNVPNKSTDPISAIRATLGGESSPSPPHDWLSLSQRMVQATRPRDRAGRRWNEAAHSALAFEQSAPHSGTLSPDAARRRSVILTTQITFPTLPARACP